MKLQSKIQFFQAVLKKPELIKKFGKPANKEYNKYFEPIRVGTNALLGYLCNLIKEVRDIGNSNDLYITYGCIGV
ncbi:MULTISPECIES: hypothetical protein [unclassified Rickettsia]|uniref:hypothetical protein n=1 Tax=unclassified Rickettsia TaxID=114295 RepID=UPI00313340FB